MSPGAKTYLGDGVYAEVVSGMIKLTTEDGADVLETIWLEAETYEALVRWVDRLKAARANQAVRS